jgi:hypothetical protein
LHLRDRDLRRLDAVRPVDLDLDVARAQAKVGEARSRLDEPHDGEQVIVSRRALWLFRGRFHFPEWGIPFAGHICTAPAALQ